MKDNKTTEDWEERFDEEIPSFFRYMNLHGWTGLRKRIKQFISQELQQERERMG